MANTGPLSSAASFHANSSRWSFCPRHLNSWRDPGPNAEPSHSFPCPDVQWQPSLIIPTYRPWPAWLSAPGRQCSPVVANVGSRNRLGCIPILPLPQGELRRSCAFSKRPLSTRPPHRPETPCRSRGRACADSGRPGLRL